MTRRSLWSVAYSELHPAREREARPRSAPALVVLRQGHGGHRGHGHPRHRHAGWSAASWDWLRLLAAVLVLASLVWLAERYVHWVTTYFILTTDRVIYRQGIVAKRGMEIPLQRINTIFFSQRIFERILGLGDLKIESASRTGAEVFEDIRNPDRVQHEIYAQMEAVENRGFDRISDKIAQATAIRIVTGAGAAAAGCSRTSGRAAPRRRPRRRSAIASPSSTGCTRKVRSPTPSSRPRRPSCSSRCRRIAVAEMRVVSLVPSATETLLAWGIVPVAVTRFCEQPELPHVGGTKDPDLEAIVALRTRPRRHVRGGEPARGRRRPGDVGPRPCTWCGSTRRGRRRSADGRAGRRSRCGPARAVGAAVSDAPDATGRRRAFVPIWRRPWMTLSGGCYGSSLLAALGIDNVFAEAARPLPDDHPRRRGRARRRPGARPDRALSLRRAPPRRARAGGTRAVRRRPGPVLVGPPHAGRVPPAPGGPPRHIDIE